MDSITSFLIDHDMMVYIVVFDKSSFQISEKLFSDIAAFIDDKYVDTHFIFRRTERDTQGESRVFGTTEILSSDEPKIDMLSPEPFPQDGSVTAAFPPLGAKMPGISLEEMLKQEDESFSQTLLRKIDEKGMSDSACYKKANVDRKLFSKIRSDIHYHPSKPTAIAFAIALELSLDETKDLLRKAGFALSHSSKFDLIIEYFITNENYNVFEINEALFAFDQALLGN